METSSTRLYSLDLLRGIDILTLVVIAPILAAYHAMWGLPETVTTQLTHVAWEGLHVWDLVMPWFIFMCGAAIPFALPKYLSDGKPKGRFWWHLLKRVALLWILGMAVQGNLLSFDVERIVPYNNTLQAIAMGYLIAAVVWLLPWRWSQVTVTIALAVGYGVLLACLGDYTPEGNFAIKVEQLVFPMNHDGYGWTLTSMMFGAMTLCGMHCAQLLKSSIAPFIKLALLVVIGNMLLGIGFILEYWEPAIKRIYTVSFTAQALGWGVLVLAALYLLADILKMKRGLGIVTCFGRHALLAYLCGTLFMPIFLTASHILTQGVEQLWSADGERFTLSVVSVLLIVAVVALRDRLTTRK